MGINENDVAILIPTYQRADMIGDALRSALATGAGEIIVSDNCSNDGTKEIISQYKDPRLRIIYQRENLGLWRNHLSLIQNTNKPWIKFLHSDDRISSDGLRTMCKVVSEKTSVVSALPLYEKLSTGEKEIEFFLSDARCWTSDEYMKRLLIVGNELGTPSATLINSKFIERKPKAWQNDLSCDLIANVIVASRGDVVLLPPGPIIVGCHDGRDIVKSSFELSVKRLRNTIIYLNSQDDVRIKKFSAIFAFVYGFGNFRSMIGLIRRRRKFWYSEFIKDIYNIIRLADSSYTIRQPKNIYNMMAWKYGRRVGKNLDTCPVIR